MSANRRRRGRRDESLLMLAVKAPWWVGLCLAGIAYVGLRFVLPSALCGQRDDCGAIVKAVMPVFGQIALPLAGLFILAALISAVRFAARRLKRRRLLDRQKHRR